MKVVDVFPYGGLVIPRASVSAFENACSVEMRCHRLSNGETYRGRAGPILVPMEIAQSVVGVYGLDDRRLPWCRPVEDCIAEVSQAVAAADATETPRRAPARTFPNILTRPAAALSDWQRQLH